MKRKKVRKIFMECAIREAKKGNKDLGKYPIGAAIVKDDKIIAKSCNGLPNNLDPMAHAEMLAIKLAAKKLKTRDLSDCILYTTNEPCAMCAGATVWANMKGVVFGASVSDLERFWSKRRNKTSKRRFIFIPCKNILSKSKPRISITGNFLRKECLRLFDFYDSELRR